MTFTRDQIQAELIQLFQGHAQDGVTVSDKSHLVADLGIDSLGVMEIIADIEDKFAVQIPDEALREVDTVSDVVRAIEGKLTADGRLQG